MTNLEKYFSTSDAAMHMEVHMLHRLGRLRIAVYACNPYSRHHGHDLDEIVTCPSCGARLRYGSCYASRGFFTQTVSSSLAVCPACHEKEYGK